MNNNIIIQIIYPCGLSHTSVFNFGFVPFDFISKSMKEPHSETKIGAFICNEKHLPIKYNQTKIPPHT